ncbi:MAG: TIGR02584 family CRISPR-associated protein [Flavobacteriaceae bacterium]|nr:MAG: TIGR02584 family CRISPR-associated protein [Flavobacteriaceae bacterium]
MKHIALFVIGHSPALVTETLAASTSNPPQSIKICTTQSGAKILRERFFDDGGWAQFQAVYPCYQGTSFDTNSIISPEGLDDIRNAQENQIISQAILEMVQEAAQNTSMISASIAGGRKTMGYLLGFAMSIFGRAQDRLTHVLVPAEWERDRNFLFPQPLDANQITLVDIPFVRLGNYLKPAIAKAHVETIVASAQTAIDMAALHTVELRIRSRDLVYLGHTINLPEREFSILQFFAQQKLRHCSQPKQSLCGDCRECFLSIEDMDERKEDLLAVRMQFGGIHDAMYERFEAAWNERRAAGAILPEVIRRTSEAVEKVLGADPRSEQVMIRNVGKRGNPRYGFMADKTQIRVERE